MANVRSAIVLLAIAGMCACNRQPVESASSGALPPVQVPVGPLPGPTKATDLPKNPYYGNQVALYEGRKLFDQYNCSGCHGGHGGGGMGPSLRDKDWIYGSSDAHIFSSIAEGRAHGMPAWGTRIPDEQIWKLVAYIQSMRTSQEPDPPVTTPEPKALKKAE
jgi:cytochrome c oxidase cbb3-type subunit 3